MNLLKDKIRPIYFNYLAAAFGSSIIPSIYGMVDLAVVGKYQGPEGTAAISIISPVWNIIYSLGLLAGIGGAVLFSNQRGRNPEDVKSSNEFFTAAIIAGSVFALAAWIMLIFFDEQLLTLFGANESLMPLARAYIYPIKFAVPLFVFNNLISAFLRNDNDPSLATKAVMCGGIFNVFGDFFFVFTLNMGIMGAGLATVIGSGITLSIMMTHFKSSKNTLTLVKPTQLKEKISKIVSIGFSTFFVDVAMGLFINKVSVL